VIKREQEHEFHQAQCGYSLDDELHVTFTMRNMAQEGLYGEYIQLCPVEVYFLRKRSVHIRGLLPSSQLREYPWPWRRQPKLVRMPMTMG
jgi:hypothetical protein